MRLFGFVLVAPLLSLGITSLVRAQLESEFRFEVHRQLPAIESARLAQATVQRFCDDARTNASEVCTISSRLGVLQMAAWGAAGVGVLLIASIAVTGLLARRSRDLVLLCFEPGLYVTAAVGIGLTLTHALILIASMFFGESAFLHQVHVGALVTIGLGAVAGIAAIARNTFGLVQRAETTTTGLAVKRNEAPQLWRVIESTADRLGAVPPEHVVIGLEPNFFVTEADTVTLRERLTGRTLYCSLSLVRILRMDEFVAVIGHELGHFRGDDTRFSQRFYPIYRGTIGSIASLRAAGGGWSALALLPALALFSYFLEAFAAAERSLGRERELAADQAGVSVTNSDVMAAALVKVHAYGGLWAETQQRVIDTMKQGHLLLNISQTFADISAERATPGILDGVAETHLNHPTDSHPPLGVRLAALSRSVDSVESAALLVRPADAAVSLLPDAEGQEQTITTLYQLRLAEAFGLDSSAMRSESGRLSARSPVKRCHWCGTKVMPTQEDSCPSCGRSLVRRTAGLAT
jgi:Zn-dependent protease with chaperone function